VTDHASKTARCYSVRQLARYWRCAPARVRKLIRQGVVKTFQLGRYLRINPEAVAEAERLLAPAPARVQRKRTRNLNISPRVDSLVDSW
jgi:hypothetical protein